MTLRSAVCSEHYDKVVKANEEGKQHSIRHIPICIRPDLPSQVVQAFQHTKQQFLRRILGKKLTRSTGLHKVLEEDEYGAEEPFCIFKAKRLSNVFGELLELVEIGELHGNVKPNPEISGDVVGLMKLLYHYGIDTIQSGVEEELKEVNQKCGHVNKDLDVQCKQRLLRTMLRICSIRTCQTTIHQIIGTENIRAKMSLQSQVVPTNEQGVEHIQDFTISVAPPNEDAEMQGMEHTQYIMRSGTSYEVVQANENQLGIEHIQYSMRSGTPCEVVQANEVETQQGIKHIQYCMRSGNEVVQVNADETQQGIEHIQYCMRSGTPCEAEQANEGESQQGIEHVQYCMRSDAPYQVVQANKDENQQGIEHVQYCMKSDAPYQVVQANEDENQQGMEQISYGMSSTTTSEVVQAYEHENLQRVEHIQSTMRSTGLRKVLYETRFGYEQIFDNDKAKRLSGLFDELLELVAKGEPEPLFSVKKLMNFYMEM
ncbi:hypothetical protein AgCh_035190 [Apium graveolens]